MFRLFLEDLVLRNQFWSEVQEEDLPPTPYGPSEIMELLLSESGSDISFNDVYFYLFCGKFFRSRSERRPPSDRCATTPRAKEEFSGNFQSALKVVKYLLQPIAREGAGRERVAEDVRAALVCFE